MQVNLHGSSCIPGVFLYCFGHRKKAKFSTKSARKYAILTPKSEKILWEGGHPLPTPHTPWRLSRLDSAHSPSALDFAPNFNLWIRPMNVGLLPLMFRRSDSDVLLERKFLKLSVCLCKQILLVH